ncbi:histidine kinase [Nonomuraea aridisoli]|uniref:histidine kinase n=1 Tax=Nonomuraea aridisoli TaxID=2070368 RepID=UPI0015E8C252|nr:histidine kinase dimerization/phosphoacceptor domain-containing protein [Nonomuraea aridisoli]
MLSGVVVAAVLLDPARRAAVPLGLAVLGALALPARGRWPVAAVLIACPAFCGVLASGGLLVAACVPALAAVHTAAVRGRRATAAFGVLAVVAGAALWPAAGAPARIVFTGTWAALFSGALLAGAVVAARRETAAVRERQRLAEERLWLAREVHDVVGQSVTSVAVQSAAALHLLGDREPDRPELRDVLTGIRDTSRARCASCGPRWDGCTASRRAWTGSVRWRRPCGTRACA